MVIQFGVKEHIKMAETYQWAEEELVKYLKLQNELIEDSKRYWNGETADAFRQDYEYMLQEGEYAAFMKYVRGMKEVMEESIPRFRRLQQMVVELPTAYGLPCDEEAPEILRLDEEAVAKYHELSDEIIAKNRYFCDEMTRIMDGCEGLVDFSEEKRELEELREEMHQMEVFKSKLDEYADEMRRMDNWMVERLSEFVIKTDGKTNKALLSKGSVNENCISHASEKALEKSLNDIENPEEVTGNAEEKQGFLSFIRGESAGIDLETGREEIDELYSRGIITYEQYKYFQQVINWISCNHLPGSAIEEIRIQAEKEYTEIINNYILDTYINEDALMKLGWDLSCLDSRLGDNFLEDLKAMMLEYGLTDERSITYFLFTISTESGNGMKMLEKLYAGDVIGSTYTKYTRGAGLMQLTGVAQKAFLEYLLDNTEDEEERIILERYINNFEVTDPSEEGEKWDNPVDELNQNELGISFLPVADYIAEYYPIESAVWFWCVCEKAEIDGRLYSLNDCIQTDWNEVFNDDTWKVDEDEYNLMMYAGIQCAVNGSEFKPRGIGRFFMTWNYIEFSEETFCHSEDEKTGPHDGAIILYYREDNNNPDSYKTAESYKPNSWDETEENPGRLAFYNEHIEYFENLWINQ